jgi:methylenetetrahydrofolate dehydrogenase (NADP+)/methenyltetrahydrofolate cyclohydrolase
MAKVIYGKVIAEGIKNSVKKDMQRSKTSRIPGLATVLVGDDSASKIYIKKKNEASKEVGFHFQKILLPQEANQRELLGAIEELNKNEEINGILIQLPLPPHIDEKKIICSVDPSKDVDGFHPLNMGNTLMGNEHLVPCTPLAVLKIIEHEKIDLKGKNVVIVSHSYHIGKPLGALVLNRNGSVIIVHEYTPNIQALTKEADILISATGVPRLIKKEFVRRNSTIIDVGIVKQRDGSICGDVDFNQVKDKAKAITPVPGGVGPVTVACLMLNTYKIFKKEVFGQDFVI